MMKKVLTGVVGLVALASTAAWSANVEIKGQGVAFAPATVFVNVGDTLDFRNMASHFVESIPEMMPEGAAKMVSEMGADYSYTAAKEGIYVFKCPPHWGARMGGIAVVGKPANAGAIVDKYLEAATGPNGPAKGLLTKLKEELKAHGM